jgi:hypothetical protein
MKFKSIILTALLMLLPLSVVAAANDSLARIIAKPIPPGYHFTTPEATINQWIAESNVTAMRNHAWDIWSGMTANSGEFYKGKQLPIWETWYGSDDVFQFIPATGEMNAADFLASHRMQLRAFVQPHQFTHIKAGLKMLQVLGPPETRLMSFNKFNSEAATFIITPQAGPGRRVYHYNSGPSLDDLNKAWPANTRGQDRRINDFPVASIETKPVFGLVKRTGLTPVPLWQGPDASTNAANPMLHTWTSCVLIDPKARGNKVRPATEREIADANKVEGLSCQKYLYASLSTLYWIRVTADEAAVFSKGRSGNVSADDYAVLLAIHVNSHEIPFWTWQTFYWQPGADTPNGFPGSKAGQSKNLPAPWNNYAACTNYAQTTTPGSSKMDVCFNPYLETSPGIPAGLSSNCMSCHGVARVFEGEPDTPIYPRDYNAPIAFFTDPLYFNSNTTQTEFSWAIAGAPGGSFPGPHPRQAKCRGAQQACFLP